MNISAKTLSELPPGSVAVISGLTDTTPDSVRRRLSDLGFTSGTTVTTLRRAPLRDPAVYRLRDYEMCLRKREASCILITPITDQSEQTNSVEEV